MSANRRWFPPQARSALFAVSLVFNHDGTATVMKDVVAAPATRTQTVLFKTRQGTPERLAQFDTLLPDCTDNKNFKVLVTALPKSGSLSAITEDAPDPDPACGGRKHHLLVILYAAKLPGADSVTIRAGIGKEVVDLVFDIRAE